jgi:hypothetical protein
LRPKAAVTVRPRAWTEHASGESYDLVPEAELHVTVHQPARTEDALQSYVLKKQ